MKSITQYKAGALLSYINIILTNMIGLILTPFIICSLGNSEYGLYTLIGSFVVYLSLMDIGLNNTIVRFVSKYRAEKEYELEQKFLGATMIIYLIISCLVIFIGSVMFFNLDFIFSKSLDEGQLSQAKVMYLILMFNVALVLPGGAFVAICNAYERFVFSRALSIFKYIIRSVTVFAVLSWGGKAISLVVIDTILNLIFIIISAIYVIKNIKVYFNFSAWHWKSLKPIFSYSVWIFIIAVTHSFQWNSGQLVLGINTDTIQVAIFAVGIMLGTYYGSFSGVFNTLLLPKASQKVCAGKNGTELTQFMIKVGRINNFVSFFIFTGFILFGRTFLHLWIGPTYEESWIVAILVMIAMTIPLSQSFGMSILEAKGKVSFRAIFNLVSISVGIIAGFFLSRIYGLIGMSVSLCIAMILNTVVVNFYFVKVFKFEAKLFFEKCYFKQILVLGLLLLVLEYAKCFLFINSWSVLMISIVLYSVLYFTICYLFLMNNYERNQILKRNGS